MAIRETHLAATIRHRSLPVLNDHWLGNKVLVTKWSNLKSHTHLVGTNITTTLEHGLDLSKLNRCDPVTQRFHSLKEIYMCTWNHTSAFIGVLLNTIQNSKSSKQPQHLEVKLPGRIL